MKVEYRVVPITRFQVTRYHEDEDTVACGTEQKGEYGNARTAHEVAYALCKEEHRQLGYEPGDERIQYPRQRDPAIGQSYPISVTVAEVIAALSMYDPTDIVIGDQCGKGVKVIPQESGKVLLASTRIDHKP